VKLTRPPKTRRHCSVCEKTTTWNYDPKITHSRCQECGSSCVRNVYEEKWIKKT